MNLRVVRDVAPSGEGILGLRQPMRVGSPVEDMIDVAFSDVPELLTEIKRITGHPEEPQPAIWYLGSPYTHELPEVMEERHRQVCQAAARLFERSILVYSPIAHSHAVNELGSLAQSAFEFWRPFDLGMIDRLTGLMVLMLDGWQESEGLAAEIEHARATGKPVLWVDPRFDDVHGNVAGYHLHEEQPEVVAP